MTEYITQRKPLGGLLFLLPQIFDFKDKAASRSEDEVHDKGLMKTVLAELEKLLVHANIPVSLSLSHHSPFLRRSD